jgi:hypothetical protein
MTIFKAWEIWLATVMFDDSPQVKNRPVLIVPTDGQRFICLKLTKTPPRDFYEIRVVNWKDAGLAEETTIRTGKILQLQPDSFIRKLGDLHAEDVVNIKHKLLRLQSSVYGHNES